MTTRKRNEYLDVASSGDEDASGYDSEAAQEHKGGRTAAPAVRSSKRRRIETGNSGSEGDDEIPDTEVKPTNDPAVPRNIDPNQYPPDGSIEASVKAPTTSTTNSKTKKPSTTSLPVKDKKPHKRGVIYLSRIPPFMRPSTVRHLLSPHGTITRLFLTPEAPTTYTSRRKSGGNKKRSFIDGWLEFSRRRDAKICVEAINGQIVGGKKGGWYRDDVWNAKYLRGFAWEDLMESVRREEREREEKIRVGVAREGRERKEFLRGVEAGKVEEGKSKKRKERDERKADRDGSGGQELEKREIKAPPRQGFERRFKQNEISGKKEKGTHSDEVKRVLSKIF